MSPIDRRLAAHVRQEALEGPERITAATTLAPNQVVVHADTTAGAMTITLPNVAECQGRRYYILLQVDGGDLTVAGDGLGWSNLVLTAANDRVCVESDGVAWYTVASHIT